MIPASTPALFFILDICDSDTLEKQPPKKPPEVCTYGSQ